MAPRTDFFVDAIILDPDLKSRHNLRTAATAVSSFRKVHQTANFKEALTRLKSQDLCDLVFISSSFGFDEIQTFVKEARTTLRGAECAYVAVLKGADQEESKIAGGIMNGLDGFLFEPYSVDRMQEIAQVADKVRTEHAQRRKKAAVRLLITNITKEFDKLTSYMARGFNAERAKKKFVEACASLRNVDDESLKTYYDIAIETFENAPAAQIGGEAYSGASARVKERMEKRLREQYEKEMAEELDGSAKV